MKKHKTLRRDYIIAEIALSVAFVAIFEQVAPAQTFISLIKKLESIILDY